MNFRIAKSGNEYGWRNFMILDFGFQDDAHANFPLLRSKTAIVLRSCNSARTPRLIAWFLLQPLIHRPRWELSAVSASSRGIADGLAGVLSVGDILNTAWRYRAVCGFVGAWARMTLATLAIVTWVGLCLSVMMFLCRALRGWRTPLPLW